MNPGFQCEEFVVKGRDGQNFTFVEDAVYFARSGATYRIPAGSTTDGASTPVALWVAIPPFGPYWRAAVLHDAAYRGKLERMQAGQMFVDGKINLNPTDTWAPANLDKDTCDFLLLEAMELDNVDLLRRDLIFKGVQDAGQHAFQTDRKL
jgi:hypothetical protein